MAPAAQSKPSFSPRHRWSIGFQVLLIVLVVLSVVVMVNYLSRDYFHRFNWSTKSEPELSSQTVRFVQSMTNHVKVILYYNREEPFFGTVASLLNEYKYLNRRISTEVVDYLRDATAAQRIKDQYKLVSPSQTNMVIFDCGGQVRVLDGNALTSYTLEQVADEKERVFKRRAVAFYGERMFTASLLAVSNPNRLNAYFLEGHGEHSIGNSDTNTGYSSFAALLMQNYVQPQVLTNSLLGTNTLPGPSECNLLVIPGPIRTLQGIELEKIEHYLTQGGRLLVLFNYSSAGVETGLEKILTKWGVGIGSRAIADPDHSSNPAMPWDVIVGAFSKHPVVNSLLTSDLRLQLIKPRPITQLKPTGAVADGPRVDELAFSEETAYAEGDTNHKRRFSLMAAVEKGDSKGVIASSTRIVVAGDSFFLDNSMLPSEGNRDLGDHAINWLLDRTQLLEGVAPRPVQEYRFVMTPEQLTRAGWILLGGMPGGALLLGGMVWLRRRR